MVLALTTFLKLNRIRNIRFLSGETGRYNRRQQIRAVHGGLQLNKGSGKFTHFKTLQKSDDSSSL